MQNSNPSPHPFAVPFPFSLDESLARAYARAREARAGAVPSVSDIFAAYTAHPAEHAAHADARTLEPAEPRPAERIDVGELLRVCREPIEWVLARAARRAQADPVDLAAIHRVRDAVRLRSTSAVSGAATATDGSRIRVTDLLIVAGLLLGTIDPAVVQRAAITFGECFGDTLATMLPIDPSLASYLANAAASFSRPNVPRPAVPPWYCPHAHSAL